MNHANYNKWLQGKLIPSLESRSVIVVYNASYHNRYPTSNARKGEMLFWLDKHGIRYSSDMTKAELYDIIKMHKPQYETFASDCMLVGHGHTVRLLPYQLDLSHTEKNLGSREDHSSCKNVTFILRYFQQRQSRISPRWQWKSGLLFADMLNLWKSSTWVDSTRCTASWKGS
jgi:hypothetical protein